MMYNQEKFDKIEALVEKLLQIEYQIGKAVSLEIMAKELFRKAGEMFIEDEKAAKLIKSVATTVAEVGKGQRKEYDTIKLEKDKIWNEIASIITNK